MLVSGDDLVCSFYLFALPECWSPYFALGKPVSRASLFGSGEGTLRYYFRRAVTLSSTYLVQLSNWTRFTAAPPLAILAQATWQAGEPAVNLSHPPCPCYFVKGDLSLDSFSRSQLFARRNWYHCSSNFRWLSARNEIIMPIQSLLRCTTSGEPGNYD